MTNANETLREAERRLRGEGHSRTDAAKLAADLIKTRKEIIAMSVKETREQIQLLEESRDRIFTNAKNKRGYLNGTEKELYDQMGEEIRKLKLELPANEPLSRPRPQGSGEYGGHSTGGFRSFGEQMAAVMRAGTPGGETDPRLYQTRAAGLSESVPSDGGFLVQSDFSTDLITSVYETGKLAKLCRRIPISSNSNSIEINGIDETNRASGSRFGGLTTYWLQEAGLKLESKPKFRKIKLSLKKLIGLCYATDELLQDSSALNTIIRDAFVSEFGFMLDDAIINGTGAGQPLGILNAGCLVSVAGETGQKVGTIVAENVIKGYSRLLPGSDATAVWLINRNVLPQLYQMSLAVGVGGVPVYMPAGGLSGQPFPTLFGRPVIVIEQAASVGTLGDVILADFANGYVLAEKGGIAADMSIHVRFEYDESCFRFVMRVDGQPVLANAITPYKGTANTQSHFVAIQTRA